MAEVRPLRGRVVIRPDVPTRIGNIVLAPMQRDWDREAQRKQGRKARSSHQGRILAVGDPAIGPGGHETPLLFEVGDRVVYVWNHNEKEFTKPWTDGEECCWVPQDCVLAVIE